MIAVVDDSTVGVFLIVGVGLLRKTTPSRSEGSKKWQICHGIFPAGSQYLEPCGDQVRTPSDPIFLDRAGFDLLKPISRSCSCLYPICLMLEGNGREHA